MPLKHCCLPCFRAHIAGATLPTCATDDSKSSGSAPFSFAIFFRAGIILAQEDAQEIHCKE